jgi:hypothetical protein
MHSAHKKLEAGKEGFE